MRKRGSRGKEEEKKIRRDTIKQTNKIAKIRKRKKGRKKKRSGGLDTLD